MTRRSLLALPAGVVLARLLVALAPADPLLIGVPAGVWLELAVVALSTVSLALLCRAFLPGSTEAAPRVTLAVVGLYLALVVGIGVFARMRRGSGEQYFLAGRALGSFVLLMTLFGTNMTAFTILGASGEAHRQGLRVFALMATSSAVVIPLTFLLIGVPLWRFGKRFGYATQAEFFADRYGSRALGTVVFLCSLFWLVPYVLIGVKGGGDALAAIADASVAPPSWLGSLILCLVVFVYVVLGECAAPRS